MIKKDDNLHQFGVVIDPALPFECFDPRFFDKEICDGCIKYNDCEKARNGGNINDAVSNNDAQNSSDND